jgi:hypothetical protein
MKRLSTCQQDCGVDKADPRTIRPLIIMELFSSLPDELTSASDTSNTVSTIGELCLKPAVNVVRVRVFLNETPNDHSLLVLHPAVKI